MPTQWGPTEAALDDIESIRDREVKAREERAKKKKSKHAAKTPARPQEGNKPHAGRKRPLKVSTLQITRLGAVFNLIAGYQQRRATGCTSALLTEGRTLTLFQKQEPQVEKGPSDDAKFAQVCQRISKIWLCIHHRPAQNPMVNLPFHPAVSDLFGEAWNPKLR